MNAVKAERKIWMELSHNDSHPQPGHYLITVTKRRPGSAYVILRARPIRRRDPDALPRWSLIVQPIERTPEIESLAEWWIKWYPRDKRR